MNMVASNSNRIYMAKISKKYELFASRFILSFDPVLAAQECGINQDEALEWSMNALLNEKVNELITSKLSLSSTKMNQSYVLSYLDKIVKQCLHEIPAYKERNENGQEIDVYEYKPSISLKAIELVGKHLTMFTEKVIVDSGLNESLIDKVMSEMTLDDIRKLVYN